MGVNGVSLRKAVTRVESLYFEVNYELQPKGPNYEHVVSTFSLRCEEMATRQ